MEPSFLVPLITLLGVFIAFLTLRRNRIYEGRRDTHAQNASEHAKEQSEHSKRQLELQEEQLAKKRREESLAPAIVVVSLQEPEPGRTVLRFENRSTGTASDVYFELKEAGKTRFQVPVHNHDSGVLLDELKGNSSYDHQIKHADPGCYRCAINWIDPDGTEQKTERDVVKKRESEGT